jgi:hypothetical protein
LSLASDFNLIHFTKPIKPDCMLNKKSALLLLTLAFTLSLKAQEPALDGCGYTGKSAWLQEYQKNRNSGVTDRDVDTTWLYVPVTIHIVGKNDGTGYFGTDQALRAICEMNEQYAPAYIRYYLEPGDGIRYLNNTSWYQHNWMGGSEMINENRIPGRLNAFVVADPAGNCGYAWQDAIVLGKNCSNAGNSTWAHEAGHHLSLPHTFSGWEGEEWNYTEPAPEFVNGREVERADGSNCHTAADGFCDTPAEYLNYRWSCNNDLESNTLQTDPIGENFRSDATIFMGYALDACANRFSQEQIDAMRANLYSEHQAYLQLNELPAALTNQAQPTLVSPLDTLPVQYNDFNLVFNAVPGATMYQVEIGLYNYFTPILFRQFLINPTTSNGTISVHVNKTLPINRVMFWRVKAFNEFDVCQGNQVEQIGSFRTQNLTATNDLERNLVAELAPNPVSTGTPATLFVSTEQSMDARLTLHDVSGRLCYTQLLRLSAGEQQVEIPTESLSAGAYLITLENEKGRMMKRLLVAR